MGELRGTSAPDLRTVAATQADDLAAIVAERDRYRAALVRIADAESGVWGWIARDALYPEAVR